MAQLSAPNSSEKELIMSPYADMLANQLDNGNSLGAELPDKQRDIIQKLHDTQALAKHECDALLRMIESEGATVLAFPDRSNESAHVTSGSEVA